LSGLAYQASRRLHARRALGGEERSQHAVPAGVGRQPSGRPATTDGWNAGKALHYPDGTGDPDAEGVALTGAGLAGGVFVSTERKQQRQTASAGPRCCAFDVPGTAAAGTSGAAGTSAISGHQPHRHRGVEPHRRPPGGGPQQRPGSDLLDPRLLPDPRTAFTDEHTGRRAYDPAAYPDHGDGLFFVGLEGNGTVYAYAFRPVGQRVHPGRHDRERLPERDGPSSFDPETNHLWAVCDNTLRRAAPRPSTSAPAGSSPSPTCTSSPALDGPTSTTRASRSRPRRSALTATSPSSGSDDKRRRRARAAQRHAQLHGGPTSTRDHDGINDVVDVTYPPGTLQSARSRQPDLLRRPLGRHHVGPGSSAAATATLTPLGRPQPLGGAGERRRRSQFPARLQLAGSGAHDRARPGLLRAHRRREDQHDRGVVDGESAGRHRDRERCPDHGHGRPGRIRQLYGGAGQRFPAPGLTRLTGIHRTGTVAVHAGRHCPATACLRHRHPETSSSPTPGNDQIAGTPRQTTSSSGPRLANDAVTGNGGSDLRRPRAVANEPRSSHHRPGDDWIDAGRLANNAVQCRRTAPTHRIHPAPGTTRIATGAGPRHGQRRWAATNAVTSAAGDDTLTTGSGKRRPSTAAPAPTRPTPAAATTPTSATAVRPSAVDRRAHDRAGGGRRPRRGRVHAMDTT